MAGKDASGLVPRSDRMILGVCSFIKTMIINKTHMDHDKKRPFYHKMNVFPLNVGEGRTFFPFIPP